MATKNFKKKIEDFTCAHCGTLVKGTGYTNHCPHCLWSMHVDVNPGDRLHTCGGMMKPIRVDLEKGIYTISHECQKCFLVKRNKTAPNDTFSELIEIQKRFVERQ